MQDLFINNSKKEAIFLVKQKVSQRDLFNQMLDIIKQFNDLTEFSKEIS